MRSSQLTGVVLDTGKTVLKAPVTGSTVIAGLVPKTVELTVTWSPMQPCAIPVTLMAHGVNEPGLTNASKVETSTLQHWRGPLKGS
jgi:hypothetical protein